MLRQALVAALVPVVWGGACSPEGRRVNADRNVSVVFPGSNESFEQAAGVDVKEFMPSEGNLYVLKVQGSSAMYCFAGSPVGYLNADMCCDDGAGICAAEGFFSVVDNTSALDGFNTMENGATVSVFVQECNTPTKRKGARSLQRTATQLMDTNPPAVPYEYSGGGLSACDCLNEKLELHEVKSGTGKDATDVNNWKRVMEMKLGESSTTPVLPDTSGGTCLFYKAGWGFESDEEQIVPIIPPRPMNGNSTGGRMQASTEDAIIDFSANIELPCNGAFNINNDINFCFYNIADDDTVRFVSQEAVDTLSTFCYDSQYFDETHDMFIKAMRCCMQVTFETSEGTHQVYAIKADIMSAAGCRNVNNAVNNGDGRMHHAIPAGKSPSQEEMFDISDGTGETESVLYGSFDETSFRKNSGESGFHQVCTALSDVGATCDVYKSKSTKKTGSDQRRVENTCTIPDKLVTNTPNTFHPEYAASLYNMHAKNVPSDYDCKDKSSIAPLILNTEAEEDHCRQLKEWSNMKPSQYHSSGSIPIPSALWLADTRALSDCDYLYTADKARTVPSGDFSFNCSMDRSSRVDATPLEHVTQTTGEGNDKNVWHTIGKNCGGDDCKFAPQLSYESKVYEYNKTINVMSEEVACADIGSTDNNAVVLDGGDIIFVTAAPRTRGIVHPGYEGGGYIGGSFSNPGYRMTQGAKAEPGDNVKLVSSPNGRTVESVGVVPTMKGEVTSFTGALVIDDTCYMKNHRGARQARNVVPSAGQFPRFFDVDDRYFGPKSVTDEDGQPEGCLDNTQLVGLQSFFDYYGRGYGLQNNGDGNNNPYFSVQSTDPYDAYQKQVFNNGRLKPLNGVCLSSTATGCIGYCDPVGEAEAQATAITNTVVGVLMGVADAAAAVFTDGLSLTETGALGIGSVAFSSTGISSLEDLDSGVEAITNSGSAQIHQLADISDPWKYFLRARFTALVSPVARSDVQFVEEAYLNYPSNLAASTEEKADDVDDEWIDNVRAFPSQMLAAQFGCHTAEYDGKFKKEDPIEDFTPVAHKETYTSTQNSTEQLDFAIIGKKNIAKYFGENHYHLQMGQGTSYNPVRGDAMHDCGLCSMWAPVAEEREPGAKPRYITPRVDAGGSRCMWDSEKPMRYSLDAEHNLQDTMFHRFRGAELLKNATKVTISYAWKANGRTLTWPAAGTQGSKAPAPWIQTCTSSGCTRSCVTMKPSRSAGPASRPCGPTTR
jgi:hypothetical protein